jgi:hypothetical protein
VLAALTVGTASILIPAAYVGYQATIGGRAPDTLCHATPTPQSLAARARWVDERDDWRWWPSRYDHTCIYHMPDGTTVVRRYPG